VKYFVKGKVVPVLNYVYPLLIKYHGMKMCRGSGGISPHILNRGTR